MGGVCWDDPEWRAHEAAQLRRYAREAAGLTLLPISSETEAKVARLLLEQPAWDRYYRTEVEGC